MSPLTPGELLIALHNIDSTKCDMKSIIKGNRFGCALHSFLKLTPFSGSVEKSEFVSDAKRSFCSFNT